MSDKHPGPHTAEEWCSICDSYADENQRLSDEIDRLRAELKVLEDRCALHREVSRTNNEEIDRLRAENERLREALEEIKRLNEMSGFNGCAIAEVYSKHLSDQPKETK